MHPHHSAKQLVPAHAANQSGTSLARSPITPSSPTTVMPSYNPAAHPARRHTAARAGSAPTHCPGRQLSRTIPAPSHSPAAPPPPVVIQLPKLVLRRRIARAASISSCCRSTAEMMSAGEAGACLAACAICRCIASRPFRRFCWVSAVGAFLGSVAWTSVLAGLLETIILDFSSP
jgi:hypothetical protein